MFAVVFISIIQLILKMPHSLLKGPDLNPIFVTNLTSCENLDLPRETLQGSVSTRLISPVFLFGRLKIPFILFDDTDQEVTIYSYYLIM